MDLDCGLVGACIILTQQEEAGSTALFLFSMVVTSSEKVSLAGI